MKGQARRAAIVVQQGLGDVALSLGAVQQIREHFAGDVHLVVKSRLEWQLIELAFPDLAATTLVSTEFGSRPATRWLAITRALRRARVSDFLGLHLVNTARSQLVARLTGAQRIELNAFDSNDGAHKTEHYAAMASAITGQVVRPTPFVLTQFLSHRRDVGGAVVLAPGSGVAEAHKRWPPIRYAELIRLLHSQDGSTRFVLLGAPSERELLDSIYTLAQPTGAHVEIVAPATLRESLMVLAEARVVVGGCSGSLHLAALVDAPIIGVYGPTNPGWTAPSASRVRIVREGYLCSPCYSTDFIHGCEKPGCMTAVTATAVVKALEEIEHQRAPSRLPWFPLSKLRVACRP